MSDIYLAGATVYLLLDGMRPRGKKGAMLCALGITAEGEAIPLMCRAVPQETGRHWRSLLFDIKEFQGVAAPRLIVVDTHAGLQEAVQTVYPGVPIQISIPHRLSALSRKVDKQWRAACVGEARSTFAAPTRSAAIAQFRDWQTRWMAQGEWAVRGMDAEAAMLFSFFDFPSEHWPKIRTVGQVERVFRDARRSAGPSPVDAGAGDPVDRTDAAEAPIDGRIGSSGPAEAGDAEPRAASLHGNGAEEDIALFVPDPGSVATALPQSPAEPFRIGAPPSAADEVAIAGPAEEPRDVGHPVETGIPGDAAATVVYADYSNGESAPEARVVKAAGDLEPLELPSILAGEHRPETPPRRSRTKTGEGSSRPHGGRRERRRQPGARSAESSRVPHAPTRQVPAAAASLPRAGAVDARDPGLHPETETVSAGTTPFADVLPSPVASRVAPSSARHSLPAEHPPIAISQREGSRSVAEAQVYGPAHAAESFPAWRMGLLIGLVSVAGFVAGLFLAAHL